MVLTSHIVEVLDLLQLIYQPRLEVIIYVLNCIYAQLDKLVQVSFYFSSTFTIIWPALLDEKLKAMDASLMSWLTSYLTGRHLIV